MAVLPTPPTAISVQLQPAHRFSTLDALRGVAALLVVQVHLPFLFAHHMPFPNANLAVDFFFMLSGFVLSFAYGERLATGWPLRFFLRDRLIRLYPLYLLSLPLGLARLLLLAPAEHIPLSHGGTAVLVLLALFFLPAPLLLTAGGPYAFPINLPSWSLFYELLANLLHALLLRRQTFVRLIAVVLLLAVSFFGLAYARHFANFGPYKGEIGAGVVRVALSYTYGMLLFQLWKQEKLPRFGSSLLSALLLVAVLVFPVFHGPALRGRNLWFEAVALLLIFPCAVVLGANATPGKRSLPLFSLLGTTSYAVYVFHVPLYAVYTVLWRLLLHGKPADHAPVAGLVYLLFLLAFAYAADRFYDIPVRRWWRHRTRPAAVENGSAPLSPVHNSQLRP